MATGKLQLKITCNSKPLLDYLELLKQFAKASNVAFELRQLGFELARIEVDSDPAPAHELLITFYPSDCLLSFVAASHARNRGQTCRQLN